MQERLKKLRVVLDSLIEGTYPQNRHISLAKTSMEAGRLWLGKALQYMGTENPYPNAGEDNDIVDPAVDKAGSTFILKEEDAIKSIKGIRSSLEGYFKTCHNALEVYGPGTLAHFALNNASVHILEAKMWFGLGMADLAKVSPKTTLFSGFMKDKKPMSSDTIKEVDESK